MWLQARVTVVPLRWWILPSLASFNKLAPAGICEPSTQHLGG